MCIISAVMENTLQKVRALSKDLSVVLLLDYYGGLLPEKQRRLVEYYYCDDLSLAEISEAEVITRQGARDAIVRAVKKLHDFEDTIGFAKKSDNVKKLFENYEFDKSDINLEALKKAIQEI